MTELYLGNQRCGCVLQSHDPRFIVITGGPGAGKTAVLELARRSFCEHVAVLPEAASIVFGGGFPRHATLSARRAAQRAMYHVQHEVETLVIEEHRVAVALCDRGTLDGLAYWPGRVEEFWRQVGTSQTKELERYLAVLHLAPPAAGEGYQQSSLRIETAEEAQVIDQRIGEVWKDHPNRSSLGSFGDFGEKATCALELIRRQLPPCCRQHPLENTK